MNLPWQRHRWKKRLPLTGFEDVKAGIVKWPMSVIRLSAPDTERLIELADKILLTHGVAIRMRQHLFLQKQTGSRIIPLRQLQENEAIITNWI